MKTLRMLGLSAVLVLSTLPMLDCGLFESGTQKYDLLTDKDEACMSAWADIDANLQRRSDMIPQLVAVVRGAALQEQATLTAVINARASATRPEIKLDPKSDDFSDPVKMAVFQQAQSQLGTAVGKLMMVQEKYPELQSISQYHDLSISIEGIENRLLRAREEYNRAVLSYNTELRHVSGKILNPITGHEFKQRLFFQMDPGSEKAPVINFDNTSSATSPSASK